MSLPSTYYDLVCHLRPYVVDFAEQDALDLLEEDDPPAAIHSVDDYESQFSQCIEALEEQTLGPVALQTGRSIEYLKRHLPDEQARASLTGLYATVMQEYHCVVNFMLAGRKTFHFSDNLAEHLAHTEINLKAGMVDLPFTSCLFTFTSRAVINAMHDTRLGSSGGADPNRNVAGVDYSAPISAFLTMHPADAGLPGRKLVISAWHARVPGNVYFMLKRELYLGDDWTLEQALRTEWETLSPQTATAGLNIDTIDGVVSHQGDETFYTDGLSFYRILLNAVLYLSSSQAELTPRLSARPAHNVIDDIRSDKKWRKTRQAALRVSELDYEEVGRSVGRIVVQRGLEKAVPEGRAEGSSPLVRFMVRGHWRRQAHGLAMQERKLIWITPFYKGPDLATLINKPYVVK
ncbi:hypothetical protein J7E49_21815 [Variovorax paradoxus]|nr:hypothetical protein [Variovorax paradoxus]